MILVSFLLLVSLLTNGYLIGRLHHYRRRYKERQRMAREIAGLGELDAPVLRLGELVPEVGNDRDPAQQAVNLMVPSAGWGSYTAFSDADYATLARLARLGGVIVVLHDSELPLIELLQRNAPQGTVVHDARQSCPSIQPTLMIVALKMLSDEWLQQGLSSLPTLAPQGLMLYHGWRPGLISVSVAAAVRTLSRTVPLAHIHGTSFLGHRAAAASQRGIR